MKLAAIDWTMLCSHRINRSRSLHLLLAPSINSASSM
jgi:hypothetical protein